MHTIADTTADAEPPEPAGRIVRLESAGPQLDELYRDVFEPSFHPDELCGLETLRALLDMERGDCWVTLGADGQVLGGLLGEWDPEPGVMLLSWIATRPGRRGTGVGAPMLEAALASWKAKFDPCVILSEVEDPAHHPADDAHGDPTARLAFYARRGARVLDLPYFQAALGPGQSRVDDLFLLLLHAHPKFAGLEPDTLDGAVMRAYIELYQKVCEGAIGTDPQAMALWEAIDRPGGIKVLPMPKAAA